MKTIIKTKRPKILLLAVMLPLLCAVRSASAQQVDTVFKGKIGKTFSESQEWWPEKKHAPKRAPNVIIFLIDDAGYGTSSAFGGLMETPMLDSLANNGVRFTNFHTTAICGPTRAALITGRNHHSVHMGL